MWVLASAVSPIAVGAYGVLSLELLAPAWRTGNSGPCWNSVITSERCCDTTDSPSGDATCWDPNSDMVFNKCCDEASKAEANAVRSRFNALRMDRTGDLSSCFQRGAISPNMILGKFRLAPFHGPDMQASYSSDDTARLHERRLLWRRGILEKEGRCRPRAGKQQALSLFLFGKFQRKSAGLSGPGLVVNFGAGAWEDPMYSLVMDRNLSAIFVDPMNVSDKMPKRVHVVVAKGEPGNICRVMARGGLQCPPPGSRSMKVDFLKIDIDSFDCALATAALRRMRPKAVWIEINMIIPPPINFQRQWSAPWMEFFLDTLRGGRVLSTFGCSLSAAVDIMYAAGYGLYGFDGSDAVFVRQDLSEAVGGTGIDEFLCYGEVETHMYMAEPIVWSWLHGPVHSVLEKIWCDFTLHDTLLGIGHMPFTLSL